MLFYFIVKRNGIKVWPYQLQTLGFEPDTNGSKLCLPQACQGQDAHILQREVL